MERFRDDELAAALHAARPIPRPAFAAELDERAAAGFKRRREFGSAAGLVEWLRSLRPRRIVLPIAATGLLAIVIATSVIALRSSGESSHLNMAIGGSATDAPSSAAGGGGEGRATVEPSHAKGPSGGGEPMYAPEATEIPEAAEEAESLSGKYGPGATAANGSSASAGKQIERFSGPALPNPRHRKVERSAEMVLGAGPGEVGERAGEIFAAVHANHGIVLRSSIRDGAGAGARFELLIPSDRLSDALADFSQIGEVLSRHEATADITAPTVTAGEQLRESRARIDGLLAQLASAETESEREAVEAELRGERRRASRLKAQLANLDRRASLSRVQLRIETGSSPAAGDGGSSWGIGDAAHDAGRILGVAAGVTLIGLAVLAPIALIALLAWLAQRAWARRGRERALG